MLFVHPHGKIIPSDDHHIQLAYQFYCLDEEDYKGWATLNYRGLMEEKGELDSLEKVSEKRSRIISLRMDIDENVKDNTKMWFSFI